MGLFRGLKLATQRLLNVYKKMIAHRLINNTSWKVEVRDVAVESTSIEIFKESSKKWEKIILDDSVVYMSVTLIV